MSAARSQRSSPFLRNLWGNDVAGLISLLETGFDSVAAKLEQQAAAPLAFVALLKKALLNAATGGGGSSSTVGGQPVEQQDTDAPPSALPNSSGGKQVSIASLFGSGKQMHYERLSGGARVLSSVTLFDNYVFGYKHLAPVYLNK